MKKNILLALLFSLALGAVKAQDDDRPSASERFPILPPFTLLASDSSKLTREDLPKHKKTMVLYFSPDCDHCRNQTDAILKNIDKFSDVVIVMATYQPFEEMVAFEKEHSLKNYPNIRLGRDTQYFFAPFYRVRNLPYQALYDSKRNLIKTFEGNVSIDKLLKAFEQKNSRKKK